MRLIFVVFMLVNSTLSNGQQFIQNIRGVVTDEASNVPIPLATVTLLNIHPVFGTVTDSAGNFTMANVPVGRYNIEVSSIGYKPTIIRELLVSSGKEAFVTILIKENITALDAVVVEAKVNKEAPVNSMATVSARMLSVEEAKRYAGGFDDPARLAASFAGVASNVGNNGIVVRGNAPKFLQWKMEGIEIPNPNHFADLDAFGGGGISALSSQLLANSDFFTGAFPAEYNNALSGVFDLLMRNGNNNKQQHTFQIGAIGLDASSEGPFKKGGTSSYLFNYRYSTLALASSLLPEGSEAIKYQDLSFKLNFPTKKAGVFSVWGVGLIDHSGPKAETDTALWLYKEDRQESDVKQYMGAAGISHKYFLNYKTHIKTTLAATVTRMDLDTKKLNSAMEFMPQNKIRNTNWNFVLSSYLNTKFSSKHTNKTGLSATVFKYNMLLKDAGESGSLLQTIAEGNGFSSLLSAYSSSSFRINNTFTLNAGINSQVFTLNNHFTVEPRLGLKWQLKENQYMGLAYGLHSRLERLNYYFAKSSSASSELGNKNMDFTKAHHFVLSYGRNLSENIVIKIEPYFQQLFNIPVVPDSSFSFINLQNEWFINQRLENTGKGRNYGVDITLEKYLSHGYYFLFTSSIFDSKYKGGDGVWRNTRFNRKYLFNWLGGKEWQTGKFRQNVFGLNVRLAFQGGDRYSPINEDASEITRNVVHDENKAFSKQLSPSFLTHLTASYKINKKKVSQEIALKLLNATMYKEFFGFRYNLINSKVEEYRQPIIIPNISYKVEF